MSKQQDPLMKGAWTISILGSLAALPALIRHSMQLFTERYLHTDAIPSLEAALAVVLLPYALASAIAMLRLRAFSKLAWALAVLTALFTAAVSISMDSPPRAILFLVVAGVIFCFGKTIHAFEQMKKGPYNEELTLPKLAWLVSFVGAGWAMWGVGVVVLHPMIPTTDDLLRRYLPRLLLALLMSALPYCLARSIQARQDTQDGKAVTEPAAQVQEEQYQ